MALTIYQYPRCSTCRKALGALDELGARYEAIDLVASPPSKATLEDLWKRSGKPLRAMFNTSGESYRDGGFKDKLETMTDEQALAALSKDGKLIKRPILDTGKTVLVGFKAEEYAALRKRRLSDRYRTRPFTRARGALMTRAMYDEARAGELTAEMERAIVRELLRQWHLVNYAHFREAMRPPVVELSETARELGQWSPATRTIRLARRLVLGHSWGVVVEVLKHEMAHQYAHEILRATDETAHGEAFRDVCARMGIDAAASGIPQERSEEEARVAERIAKLLALAESDNKNEAEAAMTAAQKLMLKHNLAARGARADYGFRHLGVPTGRVTEAERILANLLIAHFFVDAIWVPVWRPLEGKRGTVLEVVGTHANLELAAYVHAFLLDTAQRSWKKHQRDTGLRSNRDRQKYHAGMMLGFQEKLRAQATESRREGLVWVKDGMLEDFFRKRHPRVRNVTYRSGRGSEAYAEGRAAGRNIVLHKPVSQGSSGGSVRLLGK